MGSRVTIPIQITATNNDIGFIEHQRTCELRDVIGVVLSIAVELMREKRWTIALSPLAILIPAITLFNYCDERVFSRRWAAELLDQSKSRPRPRWIAVPRPVPQTAMGGSV